MRFPFLLTACLVLPLAGQAEPPQDLRLFFQQNCVRCHGVDGSARDGAGQKLRGQDLTDAKWAGKTSDADIADALLYGKFFGLAMPAFKKQLSAEQARRMAVEVVRKAEKGKVIEPEKAAVQPVRAGDVPGLEKP